MTTQAESPPKPTAKDYKGRLKPIWCPGCGDYGVLNALMSALAELEIVSDDLAIVSGIGCSSRLPGFVKAYGFHGVHGRALPVALGVKAGNPRLTVLIVGGDGDGLSIGAGHFPHLARRNVDVTYLMLDNRIYGLTKGQTSPTTPQGIWTKTSPDGVIEYPMNPAVLALTYGATFVARGFSSQVKPLTSLITAAIRHRGFSMLQVLSPCVTFGRECGFKTITERLKERPEGHDVRDAARAYLLATDSESIYTGILYQDERPEFIATLQEKGGARGRELEDGVPGIDVDRLIDRFS
jgi:2-oxoglutarate ferredoxin oxidoreductase subunit beta